MDESIGTGLAVLGAAIGSKELVIKILGPTADYIGAGLKNWTERRVNNLVKIFEIGHKKLGNKIEVDGQVPPRVLKGILEEGSFCEDEIAREYFGGVLASSRSGVPRDDRGASFTELIGRLTAYQIRTHFIFYHMIKSVFDGSSASITTDEGRRQLEVFIPYRSYGTAMDFVPEENFEVILSHAIYGLFRESLIENEFRMGNQAFLKASFQEAPAGGIIFQPSVFGVELYLWAHGRGDVAPADFLKQQITLEPGIAVNIAPGYRATR